MAASPTPPTAPTRPDGPAALDQIPTQRKRQRRGASTVPGFFAVQCSDPPGVIKHPALNALPSPVPAAPPSMAELDQSYLAALNAGGIIITDVRLATQGAHEICSALAAGQSKSAVEADIMATNHTITAVNAATVVNSERAAQVQEVEWCKQTLHQQSRGRYRLRADPVAILRLGPHVFWMVLAPGPSEGRRHRR
jgi:hypothetical protein